MKAAHAQQEWSHSSRRGRAEDDSGVEAQVHEERVRSFQERVWLISWCVWKLTTICIYGGGRASGIEDCMWIFTEKKKIVCE